MNVDPFPRSIRDAFLLKRRSDRGLECPQQLVDHVAGDGIQRRTKLVTHRRENRALGAVRLFGNLPRDSSHLDGIL